MFLLGLMKPPWILVGTILALEFFSCTIGASAIKNVHVSLSFHFVGQGPIEDLGSRSKQAYPSTPSSERITSARPVAFGKPLLSGTRLTLVSHDKPDRLFIVIKSWIDETLGASLRVNPGVPCCQVEDEEGRMHLLLHLQIEEENEDRWCLWRPDHAGFDSRSIFRRDAG